MFLVRLKSFVDLKYLILSAIASDVYAVGYFVEMLCKSQETAMIAYAFEYMGLAFIAFFYALFIFKFCGVNKVPNWLWQIIFGYDVAVLLMVVFDEYNTLFYTSTAFVEDGLFPHVVTGKGPCFIIFAVLEGLLVVASSALLWKKRNQVVDKTEKKNYNLYEIPFGRDVNIEYHVTIQRNPCLGFDEELASVKKALDGVTNSYKTLRKNYGSGKVGSEESLKIFEDLKKNFMEQFPKKDEKSPCPDVTSVLGQYNLYVDSISAIRCVVESSNIEAGGKMNKELSEDNAKMIISKARQIDNVVSRWLVSVDEMQRRDLVKRGQSLIDSLNELIGEHTGNTPQMKQAISMFRSAEQYFINTCTKR